MREGAADGDKISLEMPDCGSPLKGEGGVRGAMLMHIAPYQHGILHPSLRADRSPEGRGDQEVSCWVILAYSSFLSMDLVMDWVVEK
ncbi:MAG: hypothetical protein JWQ22_3354 [Devosia sp.]|nr:hypothetical protein [Devosia sp.]